MENILEKIIANKREEVKARRSVVPDITLLDYLGEDYSKEEDITEITKALCEGLEVDRLPTFRPKTLSLKEALLHSSNRENSNEMSATPARKRDCGEERKKSIGYFTATTSKADESMEETPRIPGVIAEFKRKSPSKGVINAEARVEDIIPSYAENGASACSVLADHEFFGGSLNDVATACKVLRENGSSQRDIPILFKEFIIVPRQILEARILGADAILLIASVSDVQKCKALAKCAHLIGMEVLLEIHNEEELDHLSCKPDIVGINNRDLTTFNTEISNSLKLAERIMERCRRELPGVAVISESGIKSVEDMKVLSECGFDGFLIGETFMRSDSPGAKLKELLSDFSQKL